MLKEEEKNYLLKMQFKNRKNIYIENKMRKTLYTNKSQLL